MRQRSPEVEAKHLQQKPRSRMQHVPERSRAGDTSSAAEGESVVRFGYVGGIRAAAMIQGGSCIPWAHSFFCHNCQVCSRALPGFPPTSLPGYSRSPRQMRPLDNSDSSNKVLIAQRSFLDNPKSTTE